MATVSFFPDRTQLDAEIARMQRAHQRRLQLFSDKTSMLPQDSPAAHLRWAYRFLRPRRCRNEDYFALLRDHRDVETLLHAIHLLPANPRQPFVQLLLAPVRLGRISLLVCPGRKLTPQQLELWRQTRLLLDPFLFHTFLFELRQDQPFYNPS